jgi:serine/threonine-protein kinase
MRRKQLHTLYHPLENAGEPFFSPDGQWIGFFANGNLQKISIRGGAPVVMATAPGYDGATWGNDGFIIAALNVNASLSRIPETGGTPTEIVSRAEAGARGLQFPQYLPGSKAILFAQPALPRESTSKFWLRERHNG